MRLLLPLLLCLSAVAQDGFLSYRVPDLSGLAKPFTPDQIAGLTLWFKAGVGTFQDAALTPAVTNNSPVFIWQDQSGNGHHLTNNIGTTFPTNLTAGLNSTNVLFFTSANGNVYFKNPDLLDSNKWTLYIVAKQEENSGWSLLLSNPSDNNPNLGFRNGNYPKVAVRYGDGSAGTSDGLGDIATNQFFYQLTATYNTNVCVLRTNGVQVNTYNTNTYFVKWAGFNVGKGSSFYGGGAGVKIAEILLYTNDMNGTVNMTNVETYLKNKYGL